MDTEFRKIFDETEYGKMHLKLEKWLTKYGGHSPHQYLIEDLFCRVEYDEVSNLISDILFGDRYYALKKTFQINTENTKNTK